MNSGPAGGPGQPPQGLQASSSTASRDARDQHSQQGTDPGLITIMNITVPPVVPVPAGLRFVHPSYLPPPQPHPHPSSQSVASVTQVAQVASSNSASPVSASAGPTSIVQQQVSRQQHPPSAPSPASSAAAAYTRDVYRNASPNVNERVAISISSSPVSSQVVGVGSEYVVSGRGGDRPRISLLPAPASIAPAASPTAPTDYHTAAGTRNNRASGGPAGILAMQPQDYRPSPVDMAQLQQDAPPFKKIRLGQPTQQLPPTQQQQAQQQQQQQSISQTECQRITSAQDSLINKQKHIQQLPPLRIDTRTTGAYTPQTEAISPTLPEPNTQEDAAFRSTKDDLLQQIAKVDREIAKRESQITKLRKKMKELEEVANQPLEGPGSKRPAEEASLQPKHQSLVQKIYAENRKKAEDAHKLLDRLGPKVKLPLYNQPSDTSIYQENRQKHQCMKARLVNRLRDEHMERASLHRQQSQTYAILVQEWHRKVEKLESTQKRKTKEAKNREFFEKVFPELRKQREDKERFNRVGARVKSEADIEEIMDSLQEQEEELSTELKNALKARQMEEKKMRSYAVIPPLLLDAKQRRIAFQNHNGLLQPEELEALHSERKLINVWSQTEHEMFKEKYLQHPKNFGAIAQSFEHKSVSDCVHHYYLTKKAENYKQLLRKSRRTRSSRNNPNNKVNNSNSTIGPIDILTTGVTTRLQREQQQKTQENPQNSAAASSSSNAASTSTTTISSTTSSLTSAAVTSSSAGTTSSSSSRDTGIATASSSSSSNAAVASSTRSGNSAVVAALLLLDATSEPSTTTAATTTISSTASTAASASVPSTSASTTTLSVLTTTSTSSTGSKDNREANKENKEIKTEPKDTNLWIPSQIIHKDIKEESQSSSETLSSKEVIKIVENKGALSSSSNTSATNTSGQVLAIVDLQQKDKKKGASISSGSTTTSRSKDKKKENHATPMETSDEEAQGIDTIEPSGRQLGPHPCAICQQTVEAGNQSRPLSRSQASQYGLREDQVPLGARVCNTCRCKSVRGRYTTCPLPGCPNLNSSSSSKQRVKRLRALPAKWNDLPPEIRDPIIQEFQIPSNTTKCCSACFNRISRRLAPHFSGSSGDPAGDEADAIARQWTDEELEQLKKALREHGTNWHKVSEQISGKSNHQCKTYYLTFRKKLGLDQVVAEYYQSLGEERRPCLTDEEESGSSTSSCDELAVHDTSDTASAGSPANTISSSTPTASASASSTQGAGLPMPFPQSQDAKVAEKLADVAVVSLVAPSPMTSSQPPQANPPTSTREDYDSSATETADEGQGGAELDNSGLLVTLTLAPSAGGNASSGTSVNSGASSSHQPSQSIVQSQPQPPPIVQSPPCTTSNNNPLTVKDLMLGVIEMQLKRNQNSPGGSNSSVPVSSGTPTISSILKTDHRNDITFVREYKPASQAPSMPNTAIQNRDSNLATLSVVSGPHHSHRSASSPQQMSQMQATITPCPPSAPTQQQPQPSSQDMLPKEGLVVMQVQQAMRETEGTLDLSIKKPRQQQEYNHTLQPPPPHKPTAVSHYRPEPPPAATYYHSHTHPEPQGRGAKSPHIYASSPRPQAPLTPKMNKVPVPSTSHPKLSPKLSNMAPKTGSITHGTPVSNARYDGLLRQMTPPGNSSQPNPSTTPVLGSKETGSITQGTPVHPFAVDKRAPMYDYHPRSIRHSPVTTSNVPVQASPGVVVSHSQSGSSQYNSYPSRQAPSYTMEQLSSRQIIMNDYITSQQMHPRNRSSGSAEATTKNESPATLYCASTPPPQPHTQARQGVIQRHNTQKTHYPPPPPGLEAFSSLVDVAVQQPSLPVPHPPASSSGHEGLCMSIERMYTERMYTDNRSLQNMPRAISRQQAAQYQMAVAIQQREEQRERERDLLLREKQQQEEEQQQRIQREKEQQQQQLHHQQQMERMHQREKEIQQQQQQEHRLVQQQREQEMHHQAAAAAAAADHRIAVQQREKEIQQQQQQQQSHADHRLSIHQQQQQQREKDIQQQHYRLVQHQREKEMQMVAAAAQREKEHQEQHRLAMQQREKEMQQQELRLAQQKREKELQQQQQQQQADHRLAYIQQQQQRYQKQQIQQIQQQQRMEAERRHIVQIYKDQQEAQLYRELAERQCESPNVAKGSGFFQPARIQPQQPPPPPSSRHSQSSSSQQTDSSSTLTAASLIDAIITHQINQSTENSSGAPSSNNQPTRPGDRLFQGFHRDSPAEPNGQIHSPASEENTGNSATASGAGSSSSSKAITLGEHVDHIVSKDYGPPMSSYRPYQGYQISDDQWKRRKGSEPDSVKSGDERQIIRVAQQKPVSSQSQQQHQSQQSVGKQQQQFHTEPVSPPEPTTNHYPRRFYEPSTATTTTAAAPSNKSHLSPLDYVKNKIVEVMRTEDDKSSSSDRNGGGNDKEDKSCADNSPSGEMVIDESPNQPPAPTPTTFYPFNALGVHTGPPPAPPPSGGGAPVTVVKSEEPAPLLQAQYEPLSDED